MSEFPQVVDREFVFHNGLYIKKYELDIFPNDLNSREFLAEGIDAIYDSIIEHGNFGIAFMYGYPYENGGMVGGIDLAVFRGDIRKKMSLNPMVHTWTLERESGGEFKELHRSKDGTICALETVLLGRETEILLSYIHGSKELNAIKGDWPAPYVMLGR